MFLDLSFLVLACLIIVGMSIVLLCSFHKTLSPSVRIVDYTLTLAAIRCGLATRSVSTKDGHSASRVDQCPLQLGQACHRNVRCLTFRLLGGVAEIIHMYLWDPGKQGQVQISG